MGSATWVGSGRQGFSLVARELRADGIREVILPSVRCPAMAVGFQLEGIRVTDVATDDAGLLDAQALAGALAGSRGRRRAVLSADLFGSRPGPRLAAVLAAARAQGTPVVVDATHSLLDDVLVGHEPAARPEADYVVASLRKLLPVPDGGLVRGLRRAHVLTRHFSDDAVTIAGLAALAHPDDPNLSDHAEDLIDKALEPAPLSAATAAILAGLDLAELAARRRTASAALRDALRTVGHGTVNDSATCFVVVRHPDAATVRRRLIGHGVDLPLHWPGGTDDLVTIPLGGPHPAAQLAGWVAASADSGPE